MSTVGILPHALKREARELAPRVAAWLAQRGHVVRMTPGDAKALGLEDAAAERDEFQKLDLLVVLGGDGTVLHGVELAGFAGVPILGVNLGSLGFLTEGGPDDVFDALARTLSGNHTIDERATVHAQVVRANGSAEDLGPAVNEFSVERGVGMKMIRMTLTIGGQAFTSFGADGIIVATPTGSTAYAFSMRGPVVAPEMRALVVVAVGVHALFDHPLVLDADMDVEVAVRHGGRGIVVGDGRPRTEIGDGDKLQLRLGEPVVRLVRLGPDTHFTRVARKFGLPPA